MELPEVGEQCSHHECKQLDFLPVPCAGCGHRFCKVHSNPPSHNCANVQDNVVHSNKTAKVSKEVCVQPGCSVCEPLLVVCPFCSAHLCLSHRHHGCLDDEARKRVDRESWRVPKQQFSNAKQRTDRQVEDTLRNAANRSTANKIKLMKLKGKAVGDNSIPTADRVFFLVAPPVGDTLKEARAIFISRHWTVGRAVDVLARRLKVTNYNSQVGGRRLRLFSQQDGELVTQNMDATINALIMDGVIYDGSSLILEYIASESLNNGVTTFLSDTHTLDMYNW